MAKFTDVMGKVRKVLGVLTDLLLVGRARGWWSRKQGFK